MEIAKQLRSEAHRAVSSQICPKCHKEVDIEQPYVIINWRPDGAWRVGKRKVSRTFHWDCSPVPVP